MSMTRKVLKLGHGIFPYSELAKGRLRTLALIRAVVEILNDLWDDLYCLSRIGLLQSKRVQKWSEKWANRAWMMGIILDLQVLFEKKTAMADRLRSAAEKNSLDVGFAVREERDIVQYKAHVEAYWIDVSIVKLLADFGFCGITPDCHEANPCNRCISFRRA
jgi:hypothetical protein